MSRVGKLPVKLVDGVTATLTDDTIAIKGKLGEMVIPFTKNVVVKVEDNTVVVSPANAENTQDRTMWGTIRSHVANAVEGVSVGFTQVIELKGVGYKAQLQGTTLVLNLGFSHDVKYDLPQGINIEITSPTEFKVISHDKQLLGQVVSELQKYRKPEPYKGKGVHKKGEWIRRKEGKKK